MAKRLKWRTYWCAVLSTGTCLLSTARQTRRESIKAYLNDVDDGRGWNYWRRNGVSIQRVAISVKDA